MNRYASDLLGISMKDTGKNYLKNISLKMMTESSAAVHDGKELCNRMVKVNNSQILYHVSPVYVNKKIDGAVFTILDANDIHEAEISIRRTLFQQKKKAGYTFEDIRGNSEIINKTIRTAFRFASTEQTVLLTGESGTGKDLFAQAIHNAGSRKQKPFIAVNCAALPENILESELFGYVKGAFYRDSTGREKGVV